MSYLSGTIPHTADMGLWVEADSLPELFEAAAVALAEIMVSGPRDGQLRWHPVELEAESLEELLVAWLNEVLFLLEARGEVVAAAEAELSGLRLSGRLGTVPFNPQLHEVAEPVKAVTYHGASVQERGGRWRAEVVMDL